MFDPRLQSESGQETLSLSPTPAKHKRACQFREVRLCVQSLQGRRIGVRQKITSSSPGARNTSGKKSEIREFEDRSPKCQRPQILGIQL